VRRSFLVAVTAAATVLSPACTDDGDGEPTSRPTEQELADQGGDATVEVFGAGAFAQPVPGLEGEQRRTFAVGNSFFNDNWVTAPASAEGRDGLGPLFNAQSCSSCHFRDGRGQPPADPDDPERGLLIRISVLDAEGNPQPHRTLGNQLQDRAIRGVPVEGTIRITSVERPGEYADGTPYSLLAPQYDVLGADGEPIEGLLLSPRIAPAVFGVGLLEAVPADDIVALADPDDANQDGISGRANLVPDPSSPDDALVLGRFGWKAAVPTVEEQNAGAFAGDIGITSTLRPNQPCSRLQPECLSAPSGGEPELDDRKLEQVTFYTRTLAVPARRDVGAADTRAGQQAFDDLGCASCHVDELRTGSSTIAALDHQVIRPYTDLLLHDMGAALADGRPDLDGTGAAPEVGSGPDLDATGQEWRTPPLWGIGLVQTVNDHTRFLHDGRARNLEEAILWHGGEAAAARDGFLALDAKARAKLLAFLESL
jgi:CxxC motif-containing protein (DUF1111 family)